ncbi:restriction modification system DNA specificity subunit [Nostoc sp. NIES-4103]|nr:restriction modification system DNA specificity subunit [Nostoc sp. NIES-4103]
MSEELIELPEGWEWVKLGDIALPSDKKVEPTEIQSIPYIGLEHIEKDTGNLLGYGNSKDVKSTKSKFYSGDLLYGKLRPYLNKVYVVNFEGVCSTDILVFSKNSYISNEFLKYRFLTKDFVSYASQNVNGVQHPRVNFPTLADFSLALPPLNEQKRIVAKIEELNDRTQKAKEALDSIPQLCDRFRQSVLATAFRGDLTADWREQNPYVEPASVLLERTAEKLKQDFHLTNKEINKDKGFLPDSWAWTKFKLFVKRIQAGKNFSCPEVPVTKDTVGLVKISAVTWGKFDQKETKTVIDISKIDSNLFIKKGDFLISRANTIELVGASVVVDEINYSIMLSDKVWRVDFIDVNKRFINFYLKSVYGRQEIESRATGNQLSMRNISQNAFREIIVALPPLEEQEEIVNQIEALFQIIDNIQQQYQNSETYLAKLNQSILAKAFRGEIVPQDPDDEPASVLLERIRAEREKLNNSKPKSDRTSKRKRKTVEDQGVLPGFE